MDERYGFIHDKLDIKILILFILRRLPKPVDLGTLADQTLCDGGIDYFDFAECVADLVKTGHILEDDNKYSITEKGIKNGKVTETGLPFPVRMKAEKNVQALSKALRRDSLISVSHEMLRKGGLNVSLDMSDGESPMIHLELTVDDEEMAKEMEKNFSKNAENIYREIMGLLLGEAD